MLCLMIEKNTDIHVLVTWKPAPILYKLQMDFISFIHPHAKYALKLAVSIFRFRKTRIKSCYY
jgi:hypothetical protein